MPSAPKLHHFASDNNAGLCPQALAALVAANAAHAPGYGADAWTTAAADRIREVFEADAEVHFVFNGTAANAISLATICRSFNAAIVHETSHVAEDECGAPEFFSGGAKMLLAAGAYGKIGPEAIAGFCGDMGRIHASKPRAISLTQATELGTVYSLDEIRAATAEARRHGLKVHMDGARFANALVTLGCSPADMTWKAGIDILSLGGTKNGLALGEAVVVFDRALADDLAWRIKQAGQTNSKMRLMTAPWSALLTDDLWRHNARHANAMAKRLADRLAQVPGVTLMFPVEANGVFAHLSPPLQAAIRARGWKFYTFLGETGCRMMCAWDTPAEAVDAFAADVADAAAGL